MGAITGITSGELGDLLEHAGIFVAALASLVVALKTQQHVKRSDRQREDDQE
jgi:hypothetical protein